LFWEFLSRLERLLPVPELKQTVSWLSADPSVLEECVQSVWNLQQLKTLLQYCRGPGLLDRNATLPSMGDCKLSSLSQPPCRRVVDSTKLANSNSQSESMLDPSGERVKMEREDGVSGEVGLWMKLEKVKNEPMERDVTDQTPKTERGEKNGGKSKCGKQEGEELSTLATSFLLKQPRVLIPRLEIMGNSVILSSPPCPMASKEDQGARSPWRQHELLPLRGMRSLWQKGQVVTPKRKTIGQLERPLKRLPAPSENGICAEASHSSPVISPRNQNTATLPSMGDCKLSSLSQPPCRRVVDSTKLANSNSQSESMLDPSANSYRGTPVPLLPVWEEFHI
ncbi:hypothetical protein AAFF_G00299570, partial [Aldrovandia affinis]